MHDSGRSDLQAYIDLYTFRDVRARMLNSSDMTLADLLASIKSARMIQMLENHRILCNRNLSSLNRCLSADSLLLATSGMTLAHLHEYFDCICFEMYVHGCSMR